MKDVHLIFSAGIGLFEFVTLKKICLFSLLDNDECFGGPLDWFPLPIISTSPLLIDSQFVANKIRP